MKILVQSVFALEKKIITWINFLGGEPMLVDIADDLWQTLAVLLCYYYTSSFCNVLFEQFHQDHLRLKEKWQPNVG